MTAPVLPPVGVVLAGGDSRRFGRDKTRLEIGGETLVARAARTLEGVCSRVVVADRGRGGWDVDLESVPDGPGRGPAAGLLGVAERCPGFPLLALACDLPRVPPELLKALCAAHGEGWDWVVPRTSRGVEPLCALYGLAALERLARRVAAGELALHSLAPSSSPRETPEPSSSERQAQLRVRYLEGPELKSFGDPARIFLNLNRPEDLAAFEAG